MPALLAVDGYGACAGMLFLGGSRVEYKAAFVVFLAVLIAGITVFVYWIRQNSELTLAKKGYIQFLKAHLLDGTLVQQLEAIADGRISVHQPKRSWQLYLQVVISMILGVGVIFLVARFTGAGLVIRTIVGILVILPFVYFIAVGIAEEYDDNRIISYERFTSRQLLEKSQNGSVADDINELPE